MKRLLLKISVVVGTLVISFTNVPSTVYVNPYEEQHSLSNLKQEKLFKDKEKQLEAKKGIALREKDRKQEEKETHIQHLRVMKKKSICELNGNVDKKYAKMINDELQIVPLDLLTKFKEDGWHMYVTTKNIAQVYYPGLFGSVKATTNYYEDTIWIEDREAVRDAPVHELGHWFDEYLGNSINGVRWITSTREYLNIYNSEASKFIRAYNVNFYFDNKELFAEAFYMYYLNPEKLHKNCPKLYTYIDNLVKDYNDEEE